MNKALIDQVRARIEVRQAQIALYKGAGAGGPGADRGRREDQVEVFGERVRAYVAEVNANTAKVEAFKARWTATARWWTFTAWTCRPTRRTPTRSGRPTRARADVYSATVSGYKAKVDAFSTR